MDFSFIVLLRTNFVKALPRISSINITIDLGVEYRISRFIVCVNSKANGFLWEFIRLHRASVQDVAERIHTDESRVRVVLETLVESGLVERLGNGRGRYYIMSSRYSKETNSTVGYVRNRDIDALRHQALVIQLAQTKGEVTRADVVELLHVTPPQAYRILQKLKDAGQLSLEGKGAGAKYRTTK